MTTPFQLYKQANRFFRELEGAARAGNTDKVRHIYGQFTTGVPGLSPRVVHESGGASGRASVMAHRLVDSGEHQMAGLEHGATNHEWIMDSLNRLRDGRSHEGKGKFKDFMVRPSYLDEHEGPIQRPRLVPGQLDPFSIKALRDANNRALNEDPMAVSFKDSYENALWGHRGFSGRGLSGGLSPSRLGNAVAPAPKGAVWRGGVDKNLARKQDALTREAAREAARLADPHNHLLW